MRRLNELPGIWHARHAGRALAGAIRHRSPRGVVFLYHRVAGPRRDPQWLDVPPDAFATHVAWLARNATPLTLAEFESNRRSGTLPARAVSVTFDDGYADNLLAAAPLLERHGVPATVFVTAGMIGAEREFWWDDAERIAFSSRLPDSPPPGVRVAWNPSDGSPIDGGERDAWNLTQPGDPTPRHRLYRAICAMVRPLVDPEREAAMTALRRWAGVDPMPRPSHRALTIDELRDLASHPGITIGAHTMTHPVLSLLSRAAQREELERSRSVLERAIGAPVRAVAYPFGTRADVSRRTERAARDAGFDFAMSNEPGSAWRWSSRWRVPRSLVRDWDVRTFASHVESWFEG